MTTFGAVPVGGRNFFRLMQNGEAVLLFPGGVREVCVRCRLCHNPQRLLQASSWCAPRMASAAAVRVSEMAARWPIPVCHQQMRYHRDSKLTTAVFGDSQSMLMLWTEPLSLHARHTRAKARSTACSGPAARSSSVWRLGMAPPLFLLQVSSSSLSSSV